MDAAKNTAGQAEKKVQDTTQDVKDKVNPAFAAHSANPGPAIPEGFNVQQEGTKEERRAKAQELNK